MTYASFLQRIGSALIDGLIFLFIVSFVTQGHENDPVMVSIVFLLSIFIALMLMAFVAVRYSGSPGNLLLNCQVVDAKTGNPVSVKQALHRSLGLFWTIATFGIGLLWILFNKKKQALHDRLSGTVVVYNGTLDRFDESQKTLKQLLSEVR